MEEFETLAEAVAEGKRLFEESGIKGYAEVATLVEGVHPDPAWQQSFETH